jgi:hypothetical protein
MSSGPLAGGCSRSSLHGKPAWEGFGSLDALQVKIGSLGLVPSGGLADWKLLALGINRSVEATSG